MILQAVKLPHLEPTVISPAVLERTGEAILALTVHPQDPFDAHMIMVGAIYHSARHAGVSVVLDGGNGDVALTSESYQARLFRSGSWHRVWREAVGEEAFFGWGWTRWRSLRATVIRGLVPDWLRWVKRRLPPRGSIACLNLELARRVDVIKRIDRCWGSNGSLGRNFREDRRRAMTAVNPVVGRERYDRVAASSAIECRDPFMDIRLLEFSLRLPGRQLQRDGWRKLILRMAMRGLLPDEIVWRRGKEHVGWQFSQKLVELYPGYLVLAESEIAIAEPYVADIRSFVAGQALAGTDMGWFGFQVVSLAHWLQNAVVGRKRFPSGRLEKQ